MSSVFLQDNGRRHAQFGKVEISLSDAIALTERLFEPLGDVIYCVKDLDGRYLAVNSAFAERVNLKTREEIIGKSASQLFAQPLADAFDAQDANVFRSGTGIGDRLERISNRDGSIGWYLASKHPLHDNSGELVGLIGISQDLHAPSTGELKLSKLAEVVDHICSHLDEPLRVDELATMAGLSAPQFDRRMRKVFRLSSKQFVIKCRIEEATRLLTESLLPLGEIALICGFTDQSAFTRQFRATTGVPPGEFRAMHT
ncbi:MAG: PAS domain S-box-containing protein [Verrucomicrobiales bacterium]|jgi:PAS domain S-box-containing protein